MYEIKSNTFVQQTITIITQRLLNDISTSYIIRIILFGCFQNGVTDTTLPSRTLQEIIFDQYKQETTF